MFPSVFPDVQANQSGIMPIKVYQVLPSEYSTFRGSCFGEICRVHIQDVDLFRFPRSTRRLEASSHLKLNTKPWCFSLSPSFLLLLSPLPPSPLICIHTKGYAFTYNHLTFRKQHANSLTPKYLLTKHSKPIENSPWYDIQYPIKKKRLLPQ